MDLKDSTKLSFDLILISIILLKSLKKEYLLKPELLLNQPIRLLVESFSKNNLLIIEIINEIINPNARKIIMF